MASKGHRIRSSQQRSLQNHTFYGNRGYLYCGLQGIAASWWMVDVALVFPTNWKRLVASLTKWNRLLFTATCKKKLWQHQLKIGQKLYSTPHQPFLKQLYGQQCWNHNFPHDLAMGCGVKGEKVLAKICPAPQMWMLYSPHGKEGLWLERCMPFKGFDCTQ